MSRNRVELVGAVASAPELRTTPAGTTILRFGISCGEGREKLSLGVVMTGSDARELGVRIRRGATVRVTGKLRPTRSAGRTRAAQELEVLADEVLEGTADWKND